MFPDAAVLQNSGKEGWSYFFWGADNTQIVIS